MRRGRKRPATGRFRIRSGLTAPTSFPDPRDRRSHIANAGDGENAMKMDVNEQGRRRRRVSDLPKRRARARMVWEIVRWLLILGPKVAQIIEWLRS